VKVDRAIMAHGTVIRIGRSLFVFVDVHLKKGEELRAESDALLGESFAMRRLRGVISLAAAHDAPVLVLGPSGAGKERVAEAIHLQGARRGPFLPVNCAALPEQLAESELFGHASGAFTGASQKKEGLFIAAEHGTIFLDEIGELPGPVQAKLLRVLATGEVRPVGKTETRRADVRVVAATHRPVSDVLRGDLHARLSAWMLEVPPLHERRDDILRLAEAFLAREASGARLPPGAAEALLIFGWPFNVRQLEHVLTAASARAKGAVIQLEHLPDEIARTVLARAPQQPSIAPSVAPPAELLVRRDEMPTEEDLRLVLARYGGNVSKVAEFFGKDRRQIYRWMERYGIARDDR
jgi:DNA-binding NtrC family response regulator